MRVNRKHVDYFYFSSSKAYSTRCQVLNCSFLALKINQQQNIVFFEIFSKNSSTPKKHFLGIHIWRIRKTIYQSGGSLDCRFASGFQFAFTCMARISSDQASACFASSRPLSRKCLDTRSTQSFLYRRSFLVSKLCSFFSKRILQIIFRAQNLLKRMFNKIWRVH